MSDVDIHHLAAAYALDALDDHERVAFEAHYESCEVCRADVIQFRDTMAKVGSASAAAPPQSVKDAVMAEVATTRQLSPELGTVVDLSDRRRAKRLWWMAAAAALVLLIVSVSVLVVSSRDDRSFADDLARVMAEPDAVMMHLDPGEGVEGNFTVAWSETLGEAVVMGDELPPAPDGKAYELWWFPDPESTTAPASPNEDGRMAMHVLDPAGDGDVRHMVQMPEGPAAWAITLEPDDGAAVTTGSVLFVAAT